MNAQLIASYVYKGCLVALPLLVAAGMLTQEQVDAILNLVKQLPDVVLWALNIVAFVGSVLSLIRSAKTWGKK